MILEATCVEKTAPHHNKTNRHLAALRMISSIMKEETDEKMRDFMYSDYLNLERMSTRLFLDFLSRKFEGFRSKHPSTAKHLLDFSIESHRRANDSSLITTSVVVMTPDCPLCHQEHKGYKVKLDKGKTQYPYVVCGVYAKRVEVKLKQKLSAEQLSTKKVVAKVTLANLRNSMFTPNFEITDGLEEDIATVKALALSAFN
jgi:hypothetical protein